MNSKEIVKYFYEVVVSEFIMRGTHKGEFIGITPTNKIIEMRTGQRNGVIFIAPFLIGQYFVKTRPHLGSLTIGLL